jgi:hypothetical protein
MPCDRFLRAAGNDAYRTELAQRTFAILSLVPGPVFALGMSLAARNDFREETSMAVQTLSRTVFERWKDGLTAAIRDSKWNAWDCEIRSTVNEYNRRLAGTARYVPLDWSVIKAMVWVETGASNPEWKTKPMQIGVPGDPGLASLLSGKESGDLVLPPRLKGLLTVGTVKTLPAHNIRAGVGYLLMRMAKFEHASVVGADRTHYQVAVRAGDSVDRIAVANESTVEIIKKLNPAASALKPGQVLTYQKASIQRRIAGWRAISTASLALRYNGGGDPNYAQKLDYALSLIRNGSAALCEH